MVLFVKLSWRNLLRNRRRTLIAGTAIGIGLAAMIFSDALFAGMQRHMVHSATASYLGEGQVHHTGFRESFDADKTINNLDAVLATLAATPAVRAHTTRTTAFAMLNSAANTSGVSLVGIVPENERVLSLIDDALVEGAYFDNEDARDIVIGSKLAHLLEVEIGDRVVVTTTQAHTGDLAQEMFRISGVFHTNIDGMDEGMAFVRISRAQEMLGIAGAAHEVAFVFDDPATAADTTLAVWSALSATDNEALSWVELVPQLSTIMEMSKFSIAITGIILFCVVALGIINTLFMSLYERMFEFGVLRAVGTRPVVLLRMVLFEAVGLALVSIVLGVAIGGGVSELVGRTGINYGNMEIAGVTLTDRIYPILMLKQFIVYPAWLLLLTTLVGIYPALHAARIPPAQAMRKSF